MNKETQAYTVLETIDDHDGSVTSNDIDDATAIKRGSLMSVLSSLAEDGFVTRTGKGGRHDPYEYSLSATGKAALRNGDEDAVGADVDDDGDTRSGLDVLFPDSDRTADEPESVKEKPPTTTDDESTPTTPTVSADGTIAVEAPVDAWKDTLIALSNAHEPPASTRYDQFDRILRAMLAAGVDV